MQTASTYEEFRVVVSASEVGSSPYRDDVGDLVDPQVDDLFLIATVYDPIARKWNKTEIDVLAGLSPEAKLIVLCNLDPHIDALAALYDERDRTAA